MEAGVGIYRKPRRHAGGLREARDSCASAIARGVRLDDRSRAFNTEWLSAIELGFTLEVAEAMAHSALQRSGVARRAHAARRLRGSATTTNFLKHSLALYQRRRCRRASSTRRSPSPSRRRSARVYGGAGKKAELT